MPDRPHTNRKHPRDLNKRAASTVVQATVEETDDVPEPVAVSEPTPEERHAAAVALGHLGGKKRLRHSEYYARYSE